MTEIIPKNEAAELHKTLMRCYHILQKHNASQNDLNAVNAVLQKVITFF